MGEEITVGELWRWIKQHQQDIERLRDGQADTIARTVAPLTAPLAEDIGELKRDLAKHLEFHTEQTSQKVNLTWQRAGVYIAAATCLVGAITWAITLLVTHSG